MPTSVHVRRPALRSSGLARRVRFELQEVTVNKKAAVCYRNSFYNRQPLLLLRVYVTHGKQQVLLTPQPSTRPFRQPSPEGPRSHASTPLRST